MEHKHADCDTYIGKLPPYLIFTVDRKPEQKHHIKLVEEIDLKKYTQISAQPTVKYSLCAMLACTDIKAYFPVVKQNDQWIIFDTENVFKCSKNDFDEFLASDAVLLVYKFERPQIDQTVISVNR